MKKEKLERVIIKCIDNYELDESLYDILLDYYSTFRKSIIADFVDTNIRRIANFDLETQKEIISTCKQKGWKQLNPEYLGYYKRTNVEEKKEQQSKLPDDFIFRQDGKIEYQGNIYNYDEFFNNYEE